MTHTMSPSSAQTAKSIVLFGHGSRDPLWRQPIDAVAARIRMLDPQAQVSCAFLELTEPDLPTVLDEMVAAGATQVTIVPMFFGLGRHAREDLPKLTAELPQRYPGVSFHVLPAVGDDPRVSQLVATIALDAETGSF